MVPRVEDATSFRDELSRSSYRLAAIRPSQIDLDDADVPALIAGIAESTGEFLEINFNLRGSQYAIAGTVRGLEALRAGVELAPRRPAADGHLVPGIDVPFHSQYCGSGAANSGARWTGSYRATRPRPDHRAPFPTWCRGCSLDRDFIKSGIWCPPSRSLRSSPTTTPASRASARDGAHSVHRAAGVIRQPGAGSRRRICCSSRRPPADGCGAIRRDRCEELWWRVYHQHLKLPELRPQHSGSAQRRSVMPRCCSPPTGPGPGAGGRRAGQRNRPRRTSSENRPVARRPLRRRARPDDLVFDACHAGADRALGQGASTRSKELDSIRSITDGASRQRWWTTDRAEPRCH